MQENQEVGIKRQIQGTCVFYSIGKMRKRLFFHSFLSFFFLCVHVWNPSFLMLSFYCSRRISKYYQPLSFILSHLDTGDFQSLTGEILYCLSFQFCVHLKNKQTQSTRIHHLPYHPLVRALPPRTARHRDGCLRCGQSYGFAWCLWLIPFFWYLASSYSQEQKDP